MLSHPVLEETLATWSEALGAARDGYGHHAYRVFNYARRLLGTDVRDDTLATASAFHDLGIWSDNTFDYLPPSIQRARDYVEAHGGDANAIASLIDNHHSLTRAADDAVEAFRKADLIDVSAGLAPSPIPKEFIRELIAAFPYSGFQGILVKTALAWFIRHPLNPMPMMRLRASK